MITTMIILITITSARARRRCGRARASLDFISAVGPGPRVLLCSPGGRLPGAEAGGRPATVAGAGPPKCAPEGWPWPAGARGRVRQWRDNISKSLAKRQTTRQLRQVELGAWTRAPLAPGPGRSQFYKR